MDISALNLTAASGVGTVVDLKHPGTSEELGIKIEVIGYESDTCDQAAREAMRELRDKKVDASEVMKARRIALARASVQSIEGMEIGDDTVTVERLRQMLGERAWVWILEQIEDVAGDRASFFGNAGTP